MASGLWRDRNNRRPNARPRRASIQYDRRRSLSLEVDARGNLWPLGHDSYFAPIRGWLQCCSDDGWRFLNQVHADRRARTYLNTSCMCDKSARKARTFECDPTKWVGDRDAEFLARKRKRLPRRRSAIARAATSWRQSAPWSHRLAPLNRGRDSSPAAPPTWILEHWASDEDSPRLPAH